MQSIPSSSQIIQVLSSLCTYTQTHWDLFIIGAAIAEKLEPYMGWMLISVPFPLPDL